MSSIKKSNRWQGDMRVQDIFEETPSVKTFRLQSTDGAPRPFDFVAGQFMTITVPIHGEPTRRSFSISSSPLQKDSVDITIKKEHGGLFTEFVCNETKIGDLWSIQAPYGLFNFTSDQTNDIVLIAGGVGITPLMSIVRYATTSSWPGKVYFFGSFRNEDEFIYRDELLQLAKDKKIQLWLSLTRDQKTALPCQDRRWHVTDLKKKVDNLADATVYVCGPRSMIDQFRLELQNFGLQKEQIRFESFGPVRKVTS